MEEEVRRELETIRGMVLNWKRSYLEDAPAPGEGEFLALDFLDEIETHVYPYTRRLYECQYLSQSEMQQFLEYCYEQVADLRNLLNQATNLQQGG
jgi:hypothetical protein